jgi:hypothetical protein
MDPEEQAMKIMQAASKKAPQNKATTLMQEGYV